MTLEYFISVATELIYAALREFQALMASPVADAQIGSAIRILPILALPFAAARAVYHRTPPAVLTGLSLVLIELYFVYNRLTVFAAKPLVIGELLGNGGLLLLGVLLLLPQRLWTPRKESK